MLSFSEAQLITHNSALKPAHNDQWPILGPNAFAPTETSLKRTVLPQWGHFARTVSSSSASYSSGFSHISWEHFGQLRTCVDIGFPVHSKPIRRDTLV